MKRVHPSQMAFTFVANTNATAPTATTAQGRLVRKLDVRGQLLTITEWSKRSGNTAPLIRARKRKGWTDEEAVTVPACTRSAGLRIPDGHPESISWTRDTWEDDDYAWYVVAHHPEGLTLEQIAAVMGLSDERVRVIIEGALAKLRGLQEMRAEAEEREEEGFASSLEGLFFRSAGEAVA